MIVILLFFAGYFLTLIMVYLTGSHGTSMLSPIHSMVTISYGLQIIGSRLEEKSVGLTANTLWFSDSPLGYNVSSTIVSLILDLFFGDSYMYYTRDIPETTNMPSNVISSARDPSTGATVTHHTWLKKYDIQLHQKRTTSTN